MFIKSNSYSYVNINTGVTICVAVNPQCFSITYEGRWPFRKEIQTPCPLEYYVQVRVANKAVEQFGSFESNTDAVEFLESLVETANGGV